MVSTIELPARLPSKARMSQHLVYLLFATMLLQMVILVIYPPLGFGWLDPLDRIVAVPILLFYVISSVVERSTQPLLNPYCILAVFLLSMNVKTPPWLLTQLVCGSAGVLVYSFGSHWLHLATSTPMPRAAAAETRNTGKACLISQALIMVIALELIQLRIPRATVLAYAGLILSLWIVPRPCLFPMSRWELFCKSMASWFTYDPDELPGLAQSPAGPCHARMLATVLVAALLMIVLIRFQTESLTWYLESAHSRFNHRLAELSGEGVSFFGRFRYGIVAAIAIYGSLILQPIAVTVLIMFSGSLHVMQMATVAALQSRAGVIGGTDKSEAGLESHPEFDVLTASNDDNCDVDLKNTDPCVERIDASPSIHDALHCGNDIERDSVYLGNVVADFSPVLVPRKILNEHVHVLGDSGSGKTSLSLAPLMEQLIAFGDCSVIVIDLKADSLELLATLQEAAAKTRRKKGIRLPLKYFSNQRNKSTFAFNPMQQPFWKELDVNTQTDLLLGAAGLTYGTDYGEGFYSTANLSVGEEGMKLGPQSISELVENLRQIAKETKKRDLNPEIMKAGSHVLETMKRLGSVEALNVTPTSGHSAEVVNDAIDLSQVFNEPQLMYFHLSTTLSPSGAPEIARLVSYLLLAAATQSERKHQVYLVIDEFQRMVASNLEYMLQLARSMGVGMILANQSMADLKKGRADLITAVEANCRLRQWFSVSSREDQERLICSSGFTVDKKRSYSRSLNDKEEQTETWSESEEVVERLTLNDILLMNDHPKQSILRISRGAGYAQYGGMPVIVETDYHITQLEYDRRRKMSWPKAPGSFLPGSVVKPEPPIATTLPKLPGSPVFTEEVIGWTGPSHQPADPEQERNDLFAALQMNMNRTGEKRRRRK